MIFPTIEFAAFFLIVFTVSWLLMPNPRLWKPFMLAASYFFYGYADARFIALLAVSTVVNQSAAMMIYRYDEAEDTAAAPAAALVTVGGAGGGDPGVATATPQDPRVADGRLGRLLGMPAARLRRLVMITTVVLDLGLLGWFKYYGFFVDSVNSALGDVGLGGSVLPVLHIALPVGISFFTFQAMSYVLDVYRRRIEPARPIDFAVYEAFFPHLVAGPIVRASEFIPQLSGPRDPRRVPLARAVFLIVGGLVKKVVIADVISTSLVDPVFDTPGRHSALEVLIAVYGYAVQIYCDFSAYSDMAIGLALLMGFRFPDNFDRPYRSRSLQEFWRRWHMSLSSWLRDYLYIGLGGNRGGRRRTYRNLLLTMLLGGLWHGAAWTFVIWGAVHGVGMAAERWFADRRVDAARAAAESAGASGIPDTGGPPGRSPVPSQERRDGASSETGLAVDPAPTPAGTENGAPAPATRLGLPGRLGLPARVGLRSQLKAPPVPPTVSAVARRVSGHPVTRWLVTFHVVCLAWIFFRAPDLGVVGSLFGRLLSFSGGAPLVTTKVGLAIIVGMALQFLPLDFWKAPQRWFAAQPVAAQAAMVATALVIIYTIPGYAGVAPFIYFRF